MEAGSGMGIACSYRIYYVTRHSPLTHKTASVICHAALGSHRYDHQCLTLPI